MSMRIPLYQGSSSLIAHVDVPPTLKSLNHGDPVPTNAEGKDYGIIRVLTEQDGDKRFAWNPLSMPEINEARDFFNKCVAEGLVPYQVGTGGTASAKVMEEFDPFAGEVIFLPVAAVVGG